MKSAFTFLLTLIFLSSNAQQVDPDTLKERRLDTVIIKKSSIEVKPDRTIVNFPDGQAVNGLNIMELLSQVPGVIVDPMENIILAAKGGALVLIDGKNTGLSGSELASFLKGLSSADVASIELITQPPAKYEASGAGGIINIRMKKSRFNGVNGNVALNYQKSLHYRYGGSGGINFRKNNVNIFGSGSFQGGLQHVIATNERIGNGKSYLQDGVEINSFNHENFRVGADLDLNKNSTLGFLFFQSRNYSRLENFISTQIQNGQLPDTQIQTRSWLPFKTRRDNYNINFLHKKGGYTLELNADHTIFVSGVSNELTNRFTDNSGWNKAQEIKNIQDINIELSALRADFSLSFSNKIQMESGLRVGRSKSINNLTISNFSNSQWAIDSASSNLFNFNETISAAYFSLSGNFKKLSWKGGLRGEHTNINSLSLDGRGKALNTPSKSYLNLFPSFYLQYELKPARVLGFSGNRRIERPIYQDQNPSLYSLDALNSEQGNSFLMPQYSFSFELSYTHNYATSVKLSHSFTNDYIERITYRSGEGTIMIPQNVGSRRIISLNVGSPFKVSKWWSGYISATPYYHFHSTELKGFGKDTTIKSRSAGFNGYLGNNFGLGKGWKGEVSGWFSYQNTTTIYRALPIGSINLSLSRSILQDKGIIRLNVYDLLNSQRWKQTVTTGDINMQTYRKWESMGVNLSFSYRFGNSNLKQRERNEGNTESTNRIK